MARRTQIKRNLLYWWNEFLFAHEFAYETEQTPQAVAESLEQLAGISDRGIARFFGGRQRTSVEVTGNSEKSLAFTIKSARHSRKSWDDNSPYNKDGTWQAYAIAHGHIHDNNKTGTTTVEGQVRFAPLMLGFLAIGVVLNLVVFPIMYQDTMSPIITVGIFVLAWLLFYRERNRLVTQIDETIMQTKPKKSKAKRPDDDADHLELHQHDQTTHNQPSKLE